MDEKSLADLKVGDIAIVKKIAQNPMLSSMSVIFCGLGEEVIIKRMLSKGRLLCVQIGGGSYIGMRKEDARHIIIEIKPL